jgi:hypothetical protein
VNGAYLQSLLAMAGTSQDAGSLIASAFPQQRAFLDDTSRFKTALCTRRAGKSYGEGLALLSEALKRPGVSCLYVSLTRASAKRIMYKDVLKAINREYELGAKFIETELEVRLPNGSVIYLLGVDAKPEEAEKILGQKFACAVVDESASFRFDLSHLVHAILRPTLVDYGGWLAMVGTPGNVKNYFHDVTTGAIKGWSLHHWSAADNPHVAAQWEREISELIAENPLITDTPLFKQHYLGQWAIDPSMRVYRYDAERNDIADAPSCTRHILGVDLGYTDATALVVLGFRPKDKTIYVLEAEKRTGLIVSQVADWIRHVQSRYQFERIVVDNASKQAVEELVQRHALPLEAAEKRDKADAIANMNSDIITGRVLVTKAAAGLRKEWGDLVWDDRHFHKGKLVESSQCENHLSDAALYAWRAATAYAADETVAPVKDEPDDDEESPRAKAFWER